MAVTRDVLVRATPFLWELSERSKTYCNRDATKLQYISEDLQNFVIIPNKSSLSADFWNYLCEISINRPRSCKCSKIRTVLLAVLDENRTEELQAKNVER